MEQLQLTSEECLAVILYFSFLYHVPPEVIRQKIGEQMAAENGASMQEYLYQKAGYLFNKTA